MRFRSLFLAAGLVFLANGTASCAHTAAPPLRVRASDSANWPPLMVGQPLIVDFKAGERIPVTIQVDGEVVETTPSPSIVWLTVKRDFSVRILGSEIKTSIDGTHFDEKPKVPGHFQFGIQATRETGTRVVIHVTTPVHAKP